jgi:hypothetical protein
MFTTITARPKVLHVVMAGEFSLIKVKESFSDVIAQLEIQLNDKILIDGQQVIGDPVVVERFYYGEFVADCVKHFRARYMPNRDPYFAYVLHEPTLDPLRLGETVAANRGMNVKAVATIEEAIEWLELTQEDL